MSAVLRSVASCAICAVCVSVAGAREWTSVSGTKMEADFVRIVGDMVTLKKPDGETLGIRKQLLSAEDQAFLKEQAGEAVAPDASPAAEPAAGAKAGPGDQSARPSVNTSAILSEAQLADLKSEFTDEKNGSEYRFIASAGLDPKSTKNKNWKVGRALEVRVTASLEKMKTASDGKVTGIRENGSCVFYILDSEGTPVVSKSKPLDSMCPT